MRNATALFICIIVPGILSTSPGGAHSILPLTALEQNRLPVIAVTHRHDDGYDNIYEDEDDLPPPRRADPYPPPPDAAPVFEILPPPPPPSCGEFRYWNGEYCADARVQPPYTGPRW